MAKRSLNNYQPLSHRQSGAQWENIAEAYLNRHGLKLVERNFSSRFGEIDLIMEDDETLVFVEVKYRTSNQHGSGAEAITYHKQRKLSLTASWYLVKNPQRAEQFCRFDVISIAARTGHQDINWIKNAFYSTLA